MKENFLPPFAEELKVRTKRDISDTIFQLKLDLEGHQVTDKELELILSYIPRERMRKLVYAYAGMDASLFMTLTQQVRLIDAVVGQLVSPDGTLKPQASDMDITLKDALNLSAKITQMMLRDLPKVYNLERTARLEQAIGDVMEEFFTPEQQEKVLKRLEELS